MTHSEQRIYLIKELLAEDPRYHGISIPSDEQEQKDLLRSLMNVRMPKPISRDFLDIQDEYLQNERDNRGITDSAKLPSIPGDSRLVLWQGDITTLKADAIVNAANSALLGCFRPLHSCIDNIVNSRSGIQLRLFCYDRMTSRAMRNPRDRQRSRLLSICPANISCIPWDRLSAALSESRIAKPSPPVIVPVWNWL